MARLTRSILLLALLCLAGHVDLARAQSSRINARVVWVREARVYLAAPDSITLEPGAILTFSYRGKNIASGEVTAILDGELIAAKLTSGSLKKVKKPERIEIVATRPVLRAAPVLRVGYPAGGRFNLLFTCGEMTLHPRPLHSTYRTIEKGDHAYRLVRDSTFSLQAPPPDTLLIRLFDDVADEEIALERGELDVAVFWPGEPSPHIRDITRWQGQPAGVRSRGLIAATIPGAAGMREPIAIGIPERRALALLNQELFRGDLAPCAKETGGTVPPDSVASSSQPVIARFAVESTCPGRLVLERFLNRGLGPPVPAEAPRIIHVTYVDAPIRGTSDSSGARCLFAIRCPVISAPELRPYLNALGADAFANLFDCAPAGQKP